MAENDNQSKVIKGDQKTPQKGLFSTHHGQGETALDQHRQLPKPPHNNNFII